jgi:hypothetical protein
MNVLMIGSIIMMGLGILLMVGRTFLPGSVVIILGILMTLYSRYPSFQNMRTKTDPAKICICSICNHTKSKICLDSRCHCCIIIKEDTVVGHHNSPLQ